MTNTQPATVDPEQRDHLLDYFTKEKDRVEKAATAAQEAVNRAVSQRDHLVSVYRYLNAQIEHHGKPEAE